MPCGVVCCDVTRPGGGYGGYGVIRPGRCYGENDVIRLERGYGGCDVIRPGHGYGGFAYYWACGDHCAAHTGLRVRQGNAGIVPLYWDACKAGPVPAL